MSQAQPPRRSRTLNLRALAVLGGMVVTLALCVGGISWYQQGRASRTFLVEARERLKKGQTSLALGYLNRYLESHPSDVEALGLKSQVLADGARTEDDAKEAAHVLTQVIGLDPKRAGARRLLVKMNLRVPGMARAAEAQARELVKLGGDDAEAHRLLARALEQVGADDKSAKSIEEARAEYETAESKEPGDVEGAERLAALYREHLESPDKALAVLDKAVDANAKAPAKHAAALLARARHHVAARQPAKAEADIDLALKDAPEDLDVRLAAADAAVNRHDPVAARVHLKAIPEARRGELRVKATEGLVDLSEGKPSEAIDAWRSGLLIAHGGDADLTFKLAAVLLQTGRVAEAEPLVEQFRRLTGGEKPIPQARYLRGIALLERNRAADAVAELEPARYKINKGLEPDFYYRLGLAYEALPDRGKAAEAYQLAVESGGGSALAWLAIARMQSAAGKASDAVTTLHRGLALHPGDPRMLATLAQTVWVAEARKPEKERSWGEVEAALADAKKAAPGSPEVALVEAEYLMARRKTDDAIGLLEFATKVRPKSTELWLARANALARAGRLGQAVTVTEQAVTAAGPVAGFYITRASLLVVKGDVGKARDAMVEGLAKVPAEQKPLLWKTLGDYYQARKDVPSARAAYREWTRLEPENPDARVSLFGLAMTNGDEAAIASALEEVKSVAGPKAYAWRVCRVDDLLRPRPKETPDKARDDARLAEAETLTTEIETAQPQLAVGYLLEARVREAKKETDKAIAAYEKALTLGSGTAALNPLIAILVRDRRDDDLQRLRGKLATLPGDLERLATVQALRTGSKGRAEQLAALAVQGDPQGLDVRVWRAEVLQTLGKPEEAEAALKVLTEEKPTEPAPWLQLFMLRLAARRYPDAASTVEQIRQNVKTDQPELLWAQCYRALGDVRRATDYYGEAVRLWPNDMAVLTSAITFYEQAGQREASEAALRSILRRDRSNGWATRTLAQSLARHAGNFAAFAEAVELIGPSSRPDDVPDDKLARAAVFAEGPLPRHREQALAILNGLLDEMPDLAPVHEKAARLFFRSGRLKEAYEHASKAAEGDRATPDAILFDSGVLLAMKRVDDAEVQLARLVALDPDGLPVAELKARILTAKGRDKEATEALEKAFNDRANTPEALTIGEKMVHLLLAKKQPEAAERVARTLARNNGPRGKCVLAELIAPRGKAEADEAQVLIESAGKEGAAESAGGTALTLAIAPNADPRWLPIADRLLDEAAKAKAPTVDLVQKRAIVRHFQGKYDDEVALYHSVLDMRPDNYLFLNNMSWTLSEDLKQPEKGRKWVDEAIRRAGDLPHIRDTRGVILTRLGDYDAAIRDLESSARESPGGPTYYHLARASAKAGRGDDARKWRDLARKAGLERDQLQASERADWDAVMNP